MGHGKYLMFLYSTIHIFGHKIIGGMKKMYNEQNLLMGYPEKKLYYASMLLEDYSSAHSELTAITQYTYAALMSECEEITEAFESASMDEMEHLQMLGTAIKKLGYNPVFTDNTGVPWTSAVIPYGNSTRERLELAIQGECEAIRVYEEQLCVIDNCEIQEMLEHIIEEEKSHLAMFKEMLKCYC